MVTSALRRLTLTTRWAGAVLVFLTLAAIGLTSDDADVARGAYMLMAPAAWFVLVPLAHASPLAGSRCLSARRGGYSDTVGWSRS